MSNNTRAIIGKIVLALMYSAMIAPAIAYIIVRAFYV